eukprot:305001-Ditylum_brightwellii.AAC.1
MALWAKEYDLKVSLKEWYFPASRLSRHLLANQEEGLFHSEQDSGWTPTDSAVPLQVNTSDGAKSQTGHYCYRHVESKLIG